MTAATDLDAATPATEPSDPVVPTVTIPAPIVTSTAAATTASPLLAAFRHLAATLKGSGPSVGTDASPAEALAALLHRMSQALASDGRRETPAIGSLVDVSA